MDPTGSQEWAGAERPNPPPEPSGKRPEAVSAWLRELGGQPVNSWPRPVESSAPIPKTEPSGWWRAPQINVRIIDRGAEPRNPRDSGERAS